MKSSTDDKKKDTSGKPLSESTNGTHGVNGTGLPEPEPDFDFQPLEKNRGPEINHESPDFHLLDKNEQKVCKGLKIQPKAYIVMKDAVLKEALKSNGALKKKTCREICRIDSTKANRLFDFFTWSGWIAKS